MTNVEIVSIASSVSIIAISVYSIILSCRNIKQSKAAAARARARQHEHEHEKS